jgi:hypothetical protein
MGDVNNLGPERDLKQRKHAVLKISYQRDATGD